MRARVLTTGLVLAAAWGLVALPVGSYAAMFTGYIGHAGLLYSVDNGDDEAALVTFDGPPLTDVVVPSSVYVDATQESFPVTSIDDEAFEGAGVRSVSLSEGIRSVGAGAFAGSVFTELTLPSTVEQLGAQAFATSGALTVLMLGDAPAVTPAGSTGSFPAGASIVFPIDGAGYSAPEWQGYAATPYLTVTFDGNGHADVLGTQRVIGDNFPTPPAAPSADGYAFTGWFLDPEATRPYGFDAYFVHNTRLYAGWRSTAPAIDPSSQSIIGVVGVAVTPTQALVPANLGEGVSYQISPELPAGLSLDERTGIVSGTPVAQAQGEFTLTGRDLSGAEAQSHLQLDITRPAPPAAPVDVAAAPLGSQVVIAWQPGDGSEGTQYSVTADAAADPLCETVRTWCYVPSLSIGQAYTLEVRARTQYSDWSLPAIAESISIGAVSPADAADLPAAPPEGTTIALTNSTTGVPVEVVDSGSEIRVDAVGFAPGSTVYLYAYSTPTLLGQATVSPLGGLSTLVSLPTSLPAGAHRVVVQGLSTNGTVIYAASNLTITTPRAAAAPLPGSPVTVSQTRSTPSVHMIAATGGVLPWWVWVGGGVCLAGGFVIRFSQRTSPHRRDCAAQSAPR